LLTFFEDKNLNGLKDENEETVSTSNICDGENGASIKAFTTASTTCDNGGVIYSFYGDTNNNDVLDENESVINESLVLTEKEVLEVLQGVVVQMVQMERMEQMAVK